MGNNEQKKQWNLLQLEIEKGSKSRVDEHLKWFSRIKNKDVEYKKDIQHKQELKNDKLGDVFLYFDIETYEYYATKETTKEEAKIVPYLIGTLREQYSKNNDFAINSEYKAYIGLEASKLFCGDLVSHENWPKKWNYYLAAFNIDYDFNGIRPWLNTYYNDIGIRYKLTDDKRFTFGEIYINEKTKKGKYKSKLKTKNIKLIDLARWRANTTLGDYLDYINGLIYDKEGNIYSNDLSKLLYEAQSKQNFNKQSFKKLEIDYSKVNMHKKGDDYYYWNSKEDCFNNVPPTKLDLKHELRYLERDVRSLSIIRYEQILFRRNILNILEINNPIDSCKAITIPGFGKYICEEFEKKYMTETYRYPVSLQEYKNQEDSFTGGVVAGNKYITYLDEEIFKKIYPNKSFYDDEGNPIIQSFDVNSMYPWAMSKGLPVGEVFDWKPNCPHVVWYEIHFKDFITNNKNPEDKKKGILGRFYKWKQPYSCINNSCLGDSFEAGIIPNYNGSNRVYMLKELWDIFTQMNDYNMEVVAVRYQKKSKALLPLIEKLYEIKANKNKKYLAPQREPVKLTSNSIYGKMAERFKPECLQWVSNIKHYISINPHYYDYLQQKKINIPNNLNEFKKLPKRFKDNISPFINFDNDTGFCYTTNLEKRYNEKLEETRESILAGLYITQLSRVKVLTAIKDVIDNGNIFLYADTDSIKFVAINNPNIEIDKYKLGAWKNEGYFTHFGHPNKLKKYFMYNKHKNYWMVKTSGIHENYLKNKEGKFDLDMIKTIYDPKNRVLIKNSKKINIRNDWYQTVIYKTDFKFIFDDPDAEPTHILEDGILTKCK